MALSQDILVSLRQVLGSSGVTVKKEDRVVYSYDATGQSALPDAVVFPKTEGEVAGIFKLASRCRLPVVPRGSGSGMTGGAVPVQGGLVLVTSRMNRILEIDEQNFTVRVEPGVIVADLHKAVEARELFYPPDPASSAVCSIGGNIAECAGGPRAVKYGVTRDYVLGLRAVLPSGEVISTGVATAKGVAGYDLTRLIVGSEGTLAVVTEVTLRLLPNPPSVKTMAVFFTEMAEAARTVSALMGKALIPRCIEYLDQASLALVRDQLSFEIPKGVSALLILELDGTAEEVQKSGEIVRTFCLDSGAVEVRVAETPEQAGLLWQARKSLSPILYKIAPHKINEDIVVPISRIPDMVSAIEAIQRSSGLTVVSFGHAGDGNIHCNIMYDKTDPDQAKRAAAAVDTLFDMTLKLGGTITGEHGVGITKMAYLPKEIGRTELSLMKGIKRLFDPDNILNPGKIFS